MELKFCFLFLALLPAAPARSAEIKKSAWTEKLVPRAREFVELITGEKYQEAFGRFDRVMRNAMPPGKMGEVWRSIQKSAGKFQEQVGTWTEEIGSYRIVYVTCRFEKGPLDIKVVFNSKDEVTGLFFVPARPAGGYKPPSYVNPDSFREKEVTVGTGYWALPGTLAIPAGEGAFPAVVLVHGSGPNDRDETVGFNKPFRDLAGGLASRGIAVLRYDKRTRVHRWKVVLARNITVKEETIDDALEAVALLGKTKGIDPGRIFVLGHSLGGMVAPRIGMRSPEIAGLIILAGTARPLEDVLLEQYNYIFSLDGTITDREREALKKLKEQVARVKDPGLSVDVPLAELPLGTPAAYWLDLRGYKPAELARKLKHPLLILQGGRDYQVTGKDFQIWRDALLGRKNVTFRLYPDLNHLFVEGEGRSTPAEYQKAGHVAEKVIEDIAGWIGKVAAMKQPRADEGLNTSRKKN